jgi:oxygen-independent coproporphyrinogen-3 oxidase
MDNLGIYIQVPFCQTKCTYCNFHTGVVPAGRFAPYADAACREIREHRGCWSQSGVSLPPALESPVVNTVYIGGGTPSLLEPALLGTMLAALRETFRCDLEEVTLEADPETIEPEKAAAWRDLGINRISFGTQSFVDEELKAAGRMHRRSDIYRAVPILYEHGINNISFDLIAGLPKQTPSSWGQSLGETIQLSPQHVSIYMMEIDEGSRLGLEVLQSGSRYSSRDLPAEEEMAEFYETAQRELVFRHATLGQHARCRSICSDHFGGEGRDRFRGQSHAGICSGRGTLPGPAATRRHQPQPNPKAVQR